MTHADLVRLALAGDWPEFDAEVTEERERPARERRERIAAIQQELASMPAEHAERHAELVVARQRVFACRDAVKAAERELAMAGKVAGMLGADLRYDSIRRGELERELATLVAEVVRDAK